MSNPHRTRGTSFEDDLKTRYNSTKNKLPSPSFRHAAPCAPWPWVDTDDEINNDQMDLMNKEAPPIPDICSHEQCDNCWKKYPAARFPNWTDKQVEKSRITELINQQPDKDCISYYVDVDFNGHFKNADTFVAEPGDEDNVWNRVLAIERPESSRTRAIFIENLSGPMLQMLGTRFNIEPFFFSSSLNWIPSRFQADLQPGIGDTLTMTVTFLRSVSTDKMPDHKAATQPYSGQASRSTESITSTKVAQPSTLFEDSIDTKAPLKLRNMGRYLCLDLLSVHVMRNVNGNTIISYHSNLDLPTTKAKELHERIRFAGQSVYWQKMFQESSDPTLLLLTFLWHAMYAWDQALEHLYKYICRLESKAVGPGGWRITQDLHIVRAHQLFYGSLLDDFRNSIDFIRKHRNPAMTSYKIEERDKELSEMFLERECDNLTHEVDRLKKDLGMQEQRLKNVMNLVFCSVNISDSKLMRDMMGVAMRDSAAMKQIAYLTMVFLPASFVAAVFGMNTREINPSSKGTLPYYVAFAVPLTILTVWIVVAFQSRYFLGDKPFLKRLAWPWLMFQTWRNGESRREARVRHVMDRRIRDDYREAMEEIRPNGSYV